MLNRSGSVKDRRSVFGALILVAALLGIAAPAQAVEHWPGFSKVFSPDTVGPGSTVKLTFTIENFSGGPVTGLAFTDTFPAGLVIASPSGAATDCVDGVVTAPAGGDTISLVGGRAGNGVTCTVSVHVVAGSPGQYVNTSGDLTSSAGNSGSDVDTLTVDAALPGVSKSFTPNTIPLGVTSRLRITFDNEANPDPYITSLQLVDQLPSGMQVATPANLTHNCGSFATFTAGPGDTQIFASLNGFSAMFPALAASSSCNVAMDVTVSGNGSYDNMSANLISDPSFAAIPIGFATASLNVVFSSLNKVFLNDPAAPGSTVDLQFTVQNPSRTDAATNIAFTDALPAGLSLASGPVPDPACGAGSSVSGTTTLALTGGTLAAEASCTFTVTLDVPGAAAVGDYTNTTSALTATIAGLAFVGDTATDVLTIRYLPLLAKQFQTNPVGAGGTTVLTFTITNPHPTLPMTDISFVDIFDDVVPTASVVPADPVCNTGSAFYTPYFDGLGNSPAQLQVTGASLAAGASCTIDITLDVVTNAPFGTYPNITGVISATLDGGTVEGYPARDDLEVIGGPTLNKEFTNDPVLPGDMVDLKFTLSHSDVATGPASTITFTDDLALVMPGLAATGLPMPGCGGTVAGSVGGTLITLTGATLAVGATCDFTVTLQVPAGASPGAHTNITSSVIAAVGGFAVSANPATDDLRISGLTLSKEFTDDPVLPGDPVTLRFTLDNAHPTLAATSIFFSDSVASTLSGMTATSVPPSPCGGILTGTTTLFFSGGSVPALGNCSFDVTLSVPALAAEGGYINTTSAVSSSQGISSLAADQLVVELPLAPVITKAFTNDPVEVGQEVTLKFTLNNPNDTETLNDINIADDLNATLTGLQATAATVNTCGGMATSVFPTGLFSYTTPELLPGATCEIELTLLVPGTAATGSHVNTTNAPTGVFTGGEEGPFTLAGLPATDTLVVVAVGQAPKDGLAVLPTPCVIYDSVASGDGALVPDTVRTVQAAGPLSGQGGAGICIPTVATAVVVTISAINPQASGNLRLWKSGVLPDGGVVNYAANGLNNSNTVTVPLSATGALDVAANSGASDVRLVVVGFYAPDSRLSYFPLNPCAVADSRTGTGVYAGPFAAGAAYPDIDVVAGILAAQGGGNADCGVPSGADAVVVNVISLGSTGGIGGLAVGKSGTEPTENTTNFASIGLNNAASSYVLLSGDNIALNITGAGSTHVRIVVVGYLDEGGKDYTSVIPCAAFDSRTTIPGDTNVPTGVFAGERIAGPSGLTTYKITDAIPAAQGGDTSCGVPAGARAVLINLVAIGANEVGNFKASSAGTVAAGGVVNFEDLTPAMNNSNAVVIPLSAAGEMDLFVNSPTNLGLETVHARGVIMGYYI